MLYYSRSNKFIELYLDKIKYWCKFLLFLDFQCIPGLSLFNIFCNLTLFSYICQFHIVNGSRVDEGVWLVTNPNRFSFSYNNFSTLKLIVILLHHWSWLQYYLPGFLSFHHMLIPQYQVLFCDHEGCNKFFCSAFITWLSHSKV